MFYFPWLQLFLIPIVREGLLTFDSASKIVRSFVEILGKIWQQSTLNFCLNQNSTNPLSHWPSGTAITYTSINLQQWKNLHNQGFLKNYICIAVLDPHLFCLLHPLLLCGMEYIFWYHQLHLIGLAHQIVSPILNFLIYHIFLTNICYDLFFNWQTEKKTCFGPMRNLFSFSTTQTEKNLPTLLRLLVVEWTTMVHVVQI